MKYTFFVSKAQNIFAQNRILKFYCTLLTIGFFAQGIMVYAAVNYKTVVLIPPDLKQEITITNGVPNDEYVESMARDVGNLAFNYTPITARDQFSKLLKYYAPEEFPAASERWYTFAERIETAKVSATMPIESIEIDPGKKRIYMTGFQTLFNFDKIIEQNRKTYTLHYDVRRGRFSITAIEDGRK